VWAHRLAHLVGVPPPGRQIGARRVHFVLAGRDAATDWRSVFQSVTVAPGATHRASQLAVDFAVMHALDASVDPLTGQVGLDFEAADPARNVTATFAGIRGKSAPQPNDAQYKLVTAADQSSGYAYSASTSTEMAPRTRSPTSTRSGLLAGRASPTLPSAGAASELAWSTRSPPECLPRRPLSGLASWRAPQRLM